MMDDRRPPGQLGGSDLKPRGCLREIAIDRVRLGT